MDAIKAVFPKWEEGDSFEEKHGDTPEKERKSSCFDGILRTPRRMHKSYADMTLIDDPENFLSPKSRRKLNYSYESEAETDDERPRGFCFCLCVPRKKKKRKQLDKTQSKYVERRKRNDTSEDLLMKVLQPPKPITSTPSNSNIYTDYRLVSADKKSNNSAKTTQPSKSTCDHSRTKSPLRDISNERLSDSTNKHDSPSKGKQEVHKGQKKQQNGAKHAGKKPNNKENSKNRTKTGVNSDRSSNVTASCDSLKLENLEPIEHCVMWKSRGPTFESYEQKFYEILKSKQHLDIVKYFEQERGTLVLHIFTEHGLVIGTISMSIAQLKSLKTDIQNGQIVSLVEKWVLSQQVFDEIGVSDMKLKVVVDDSEFEMAYEELQ